MLTCLASKDNAGRADSAIFIAYPEGCNVVLLSSLTPKVITERYIILVWHIDRRGVLVNVPTITNTLQLAITLSSPAHLPLLPFLSHKFLSLSSILFLISIRG
jgi:hypothetical protein